MDILSKAQSTIVEYDSIIQEIMDPSNVLDQEKLTTLSKKKSALQEVYDLSIQFVSVLYVRPFNFLSLQDWIIMRHLLLSFYYASNDCRVSLLECTFYD